MIVPGFPARKRLTWHACLDMPTGLAPPRATGAGAICHVYLADQGLYHPGPCEGGAEQGWIVLLAITNPGYATVRAADLAIPLAFAFPGRQVHAVRISREPSARQGRWRGGIAAARLRAAPGPDPGRLHLTGDYALRRADSYMIFVLLSGTPAARTLPILQEGTLPGGTITPEPCPAAC